MKEPILSIIVANRNYGRFLGEALSSIEAQCGVPVVGADGRARLPLEEYGLIEIIVVDGASTDNSVDVIKRHADHIAWWVSEPDRGQSDAFNKGFAQAKGTYLTWLNADDLYLPGSLLSVVEKLRANPSASWATGNFIRFTETDKKIIQAEWGPHYLPYAFQGRHFPLMIFGPTTFWRRDVFEKLGGLEVSLHYGMDTEYWWRLTVNGYKQVRVNHCCWAFRMHTDSKTAEYGDHRNTDEVQQKKTAEYYYFVKKHHVAINRWAHLMLRLWRIVDGSYFVNLWRRWFIVGRPFKVNVLEGAH